MEKPADNEEKKEEKKDYNEEERFIECIRQTIKKYMSHGSRSSEKVNFLHNFLKSEITKCLEDKYEDKYEVKLEDTVSSCNMVGKKKCDITVYRENILVYIFPVKFIMSNYKQNKNNAWENLTGEMIHLKKQNDLVDIIPINIICNTIPYLSQDKKIKHFENIKYSESFQIYKKLVEWNLCKMTIDYIIDVKHENNIGDNYDKDPIIIGFNNETPHISFYNIF